MRAIEKMQMSPSSGRLFSPIGLLMLIGLIAPRCLADGKVVPPRDYTGSLEESAQEAVILFQGGAASASAKEDLILKITVEGEAPSFAWVVPFPNPPKTSREDPKLFKELFDYVQARRSRGRSGSKFEGNAGSAPRSAATDEKVKVISRKIVGDFDISVVREQQAGALNDWLEENGYQRLEDADDVLDFYRRKKYVFACVRVSDAALESGRPIDVHPLRFSFETGGRDGIYFPMKMTGLQTSPFDINLYVFYDKWLNDTKSKFGYVHRGFKLYYRDWDTRQCTPNAGKAYSAPDSDAFLRGMGRRLTVTTKLMQKLHPGQRFYLTNIQAKKLQPAEVRDWSDDLWLFPYYTDKRFIPYDVRGDGPASTAWPNEVAPTPRRGAGASQSRSRSTRTWLIFAVIFGGALAGVAGVFLRRKRRYVQPAK